MCRNDEKKWSKPIESSVDFHQPKSNRVRRFRIQILNAVNSDSQRLTTACLGQFSLRARGRLAKPSGCMYDDAIEVGVLQEAKQEPRYAGVHENRV